MIDERLDLKLFQELKDSSLPSENDSLEELISKKDIYDINPNTNYALLKKSIELSHKNLEKYFYEYNQTLTFHQRQDIIEKIRDTEIGGIIEKRIGLTKESFMEKYFKIIYNLKIY